MTPTREAIFAPDTLGSSEDLPGKRLDQ